jgi:outer membrane autotransporter protein
VLFRYGNGGTAGSITGNVTDNGTLAFGRSDTVTFAGAISGTGGVTQIGAGTTILTGINTYGGGTTIGSGTLQIGNGGTAGSITGNVTDNGTLAFERSDSVTFGGVISGAGTLVQSGSGTLILTGNNTYSGGTTISAGTLQVGNGGATGSIIGNVVDNGTLLFNRSNTLSFGGVISGTGNVEQNGSGSTILSGVNTYTGGTIVNAGTLTVNNSQALGLGDVVVNGGILTADPQPINVKGNYTQNAGGTLQLQVAGANPGQYDTLNVAGNATLGGTLQLLSLGFQPKAGNQLTLVTTGGVVSGQFAQFLNPFTSGPAFNTIDLVYGRNSVLLEFLNLTSPVPSPIPPPTLPPVPSPTPALAPPSVAPSSVAPPSVIVTIDFASFALTPNQLAAGNLVDRDELDPKAADLISFLFKQPFSNLPGDLEQISPDSLTAFYEISFSNANIQRLNLESRLDDLRGGSTGFSSNMKINGATVSLEDKAAEDGKSSKNTVEQVLQPGPENRWGVWVTGFGDFVNVDSDSKANGYDFTTGGFSLGVDYRITDRLAVGAMGEYAHTWTSLKPSGDIDVDSGRGGVYATWFNHGIYLNAAIYGGHNSYSSSRSTLGGMASGGTGGAEYSTFISGGYDLHCGHLTAGPIAALQYTYASIDSFGENGSLAPLNIHSQSAESLRTDTGLRAYYIWQIGKVVVEPSLRAAWEHEYKYSDLAIAAGFAGIPGPSATFFGPSEGHDSAIVSAGVSVQWTPAITTYVNYDGQLGRSRYDSNAVTGGIRISF